MMSSRKDGGQPAGAMAQKEGISRHQLIMKTR